jgi:uncharacterized membrane protein HdeD (DUF308 family)
MDERTIEELKKSRKNLSIYGIVYILFGAAYIFLGIYAHYWLSLSVTAIISIIVGALAVIMGDSLITSSENRSIIIYLKEKNREDEKFV